MPRLSPPPTPVLPDWDTTHAALRRIAGALARDPHEADDLTQQTVLKLLAAAPSDSRPLAYARQIMIRTWMDRQRSARRRLRRLAHVAARTAAGVFARDPIEADEVRLRVRSAMAALPPRQQAALVLRVIEELDVPEIAQALDCSAEAVRASLHLARRRVRESLKDLT
jgi:RNA polymerase sigma factor (sigma-70 family)